MVFRHSDLTILHQHSLKQAIAVPECPVVHSYPAIGRSGYFAVYIDVAEW